MKHLLYFAGYRMMVLRWNNNMFTGTADFEPDEKGLMAFKVLLQREVKKPVKLLVDLIEEDFRLDRIPHLFGKDRNAVQKRLIAKHFRQYSHTNLRIQSREKAGRKDDMVLLSALTNPELFKPWIDILHELKIPLQGIYSLPLVGEALLKHLDAADKDALVISQQVPGNIRQSFYTKGHLKLSRLAPGSDDAVSHYEVLREETERTIRYLENQHYADKNKAFNVYVIAPSNEHHNLQEILKNDTRKKYHLIDKDKLSFDIGIKAPTNNRYCNWLYAHLLLADKYRTVHYGTHQDKRYYYHFRARNAMYISSVAALVIATFWSLSLLTDSYILSSERQSMRDEITRYDTLYNEILNDISDLDLNVNAVRDTVDTVEEIQEKYQAKPVEFMQAISKSLDNHPLVHIKSIKWLATNDSGHTFGETKRPLDRRLLRMIQLGRKSISYEKALVEAVITNYNENPRVAVEKVNAFIKELRTQKTFDTIDVVKLPFDVDPASRMVGQGFRAGESNNSDAQFAFVMVKETEF